MIIIILILCICLVIAMYLAYCFGTLEAEYKYKYSLISRILHGSEIRDHIKEVGERLLNNEVSDDTLSDLEKLKPSLSYVEFKYLNEMEAQRIARLIIKGK